MKKIFKSLAALALVMSAGCVKELSNDTTIAPEGNQTGQTTVVTVGLEKANTKTYLGDLVDGVRNVYWSEGDQIAMNGTPSSKIDIAEGNMYATFTFDGLLNGPYKVLYPAADYVDEQTVKLPAIQEAATGTFATGSAPMAGISSNISNIHLHHLAAVIRLQVTLPAESDHAECILNRVELRGNSEEQMSGNFAINYETATLTSASNAEADKVVTTMINKALSTEATDVFVVVPAQEYAEGFSVRLIDSNGHFMDIKSKASTLAKGEIKAMPAFNFIPTGTLVGVEIRNAAELVKFAEDYNKGNYKEVSELNVKLMNDIEFDDETNTAWTPIGTSLNWFKGTFEGNNYSIKSWRASRPLFHATAGTAQIKNLVIDSSCVLTANYADKVTHFGGFVGSHRGVLYNCHNNAGVAVTGEWGGDMQVGGLVGISVNAAKVEACSMSGDISADQNLAVGGKIYLSGVVGNVDHSDARVVDTDFNGNLTINGGGTASNPYAYVGGIAGQSKGTIIECSTANDKVILGENKHNNVYYFYFGGIVGRVEGGRAEKCQNNAYVHLKYPRVSGNNNASYIGGVSGYITKDASLVDCDNAAIVQSSSDSRYVYIAGILGCVEADAVVYNCHNGENANVITSDYGSGSNGALYLYMGGVAGRCASSNISNISNAGNLEMNCVQNHTNTAVNVGGCIGFLEASLDGNNTIVNSGKVTAADAATSRSYLALGGVVGTSYGENATLSKVSNTGNVIDAVTVTQKHAFLGGVVGLVRKDATIENVTNSGKVHFANGSQLYHVNIGLGGIVGGISAIDGSDCVVVVQGSTNDGEVSRVGTNGKGIQRSAMVCGGIVGILKGAGSSVSCCTNNGLVKNEGLNSTPVDADFDPSTDYVDANSGGSGHAIGGIVGFALGGAESAVTISNCTNTGECNALRGYAGGIAGYVRNAAIAICSHNTNIVKGAAYNTRIGGVAGYINSSSVTSCDVVSNVETGSNNGYVGGVCGGMDANSSIVSSTYQGTIISSGNTKAGAIVALSVSGASLTDCQAKGKINSNDISLNNFDGSSAATQKDSGILD